MQDRFVPNREKIQGPPGKSGGFGMRREGTIEVDTPRITPDATRRTKDMIQQEQGFTHWTEALLKKTKKEYPDVSLDMHYDTEEVARGEGKESTRQTYDMVVRKKSQEELQREGVVVPERVEEEKTERIQRIAMDLIRHHSVAGDEEGLQGVVDLAFQEIIRSVAESQEEKPLYLRLHDVDGTRSLMTATSKESFENPATLFLGHLDVVGGSNGKNQFAPEIQEATVDGITKKYLVGRGSVDMKGADAAMMEAVLYERPDNTLLFLTTTEETGSSNDASFFAPTINPDVLVVPDGAKGGTYTTFAKGFLHTTLRVDGESSHGGRPWDGKDAGEPIYEAWNSFRQLPYVNPQEPTDGTTLVFPEVKVSKNGVYVESPNNSVPAFGRLKMDIRFLDQDERERFEKIVQETWGKIRSDVKYKDLVFYDPQFPAEGRVFNTHSDDPRVQLFAKQCADNGRVLKPVIEEGNSDARFWNVPALVVRMPGTDVHSSNEMVEFNSLLFYADRFAEFAQYQSDQRKNVHV